MATLHEVELIEVLSDMPDIQTLDVRSDLSGKVDDLFFCALGYEERCLHIPENLSRVGNYRAKEAYYFEFATNVADNELNKPRLLESLQQFSGTVRSIQHNMEDFTARLRELLEHVCNTSEDPNVSFDISVCSTNMLILVLRVLLEFDINLHILYSEAAVYHPTHEEYDDDPEQWTTEEGGLEKGVAKVIASPEHPGNRRDGLPEAIIVFPTFKPERTKAVITDIDESLIAKPRDRIIWVVGVPNMPEDQWRTDVIREVNMIPSSSPCYRVSTFRYKDTIERLEALYGALDCKYHLTISPLGSKLQALGIALFWYFRQDVSIVFAIPKEYNARKYSDGCKATWQVKLGSLNGIRNTLDRVGQLEIRS